MFSREIQPTYPIAAFTLTVRRLEVLPPLSEEDIDRIENLMFEIRDRAHEELRQGLKAISDGVQARFG